MIDTIEAKAEMRGAIRDNVRHVRDEIAEAARKAGRQPEDVVLMAVTKTRTREEVDAVIDAGVTILGENRVQEAETKLREVTGAAEWHLIGHLQTNKAKRAVELFSTIQSVDSARLAEKIGRHADVAEPVRILIEVNTSGEESKYGVVPEAALDLIGRARGIAGVHVAGVMTIGAFSDDERLVRRCFARLRAVRDEARSAYPDLALDVLSMGMTSDYAWAIAEGSTMVRIGTAIFGPRL